MFDKDGKVLVAIMNNLHDWQIAHDQGWYRIPVKSQQRFLKDRWPPRWLAFYQTQIFGEEKYGVRYYAEVTGIEQVTRRDLFPSEPEGPKSNRRYYRVRFGVLQKLEQPILSRRWRRIIFIPTTWQKFEAAVEINDLYDGSPLEDRLWAALKRYDFPIFRQEWVEAGGENYALDFAIYCTKASLAVETDGDRWHHTPERAAEDNLRENHLKANGWQILRFNTHQINEQTESYCVPTIIDTINTLGGPADDRFVPGQVNLDVSSPRQLGLFD